jgi:hypothetical protein
MFFDKALTSSCTGELLLVMTTMLLLQIFKFVYRPLSFFCSYLGMGSRTIVEYRFLLTLQGGAGEKQIHIT